MTQTRVAEKYSNPFTKHLLFIFAALISYGTRSLAGRLAGCLALAATAFFHRLFQIFRR